MLALALVLVLALVLSLVLVPVLALVLVVLAGPVLPSWQATRRGDGHFAAGGDPRAL